ncbi:amidase domain-containing protein [Alicyclobacillus tolerans]|uniref:amidase domain-containing protein n=1 Tax=Alicyclobacillus tolerans TaxID=90970 RepID=UPI003B980829
MVEAILHAVQTWFAARNQAWVSLDKDSNLLRNAPVATELGRKAWQEVRRMRLATLHDGMRLARAHTCVAVLDVQFKENRRLAKVLANELVYLTKVSTPAMTVEARQLEHEMTWQRNHQHWQLKEDHLLGLQEDCKMNNRIIKPAVHCVSMRDDIVNIRQWYTGKQMGYSRLLAVRYADLWWQKQNPLYAQYENDSANYVSQCLFAAGLGMSEKNSHGWWMDTARQEYAPAWTMPHLLYHSLLSRKNVIRLEKSRQCIVGDLVFYDWHGNHRPSHVAIVTDFDHQGRPLVNSHSMHVQYRPYRYLDSPIYSDRVQYLFLRIPDGTV